MVQKVAVVTKKLEIVAAIEEVTLPAELACHPVLDGARPRALSLLSNHFEVMRVPRGAAVFHAGQEAKAVYLVVSGAVRTLHRNMQGETLESAWQQGQSVLGVGELLAEATEMQESAQAVESAVIYVIPHATMREAIAFDGQLLMNLASTLAQRHVAGIKNERQALETAFVRVANYLTQLSAREGKEVAPELYLVRTTQEDVAAAAGLNPRTVSRAMKVLQKKGRLYVRRGEYLLRQPATLSLAVAGEE